MSVEEYAPDRKVLGVLIVVGLILAAGMLLVLQPSALAALSGQGGPKRTEVNVKIPYGVSTSASMRFPPRNLSRKDSLTNTTAWGAYAAEPPADAAPTRAGR